MKIKKASLLILNTWWIYPICILPSDSRNILIFIYITPQPKLFSHLSLSKEKVKILQRYAFIKAVGSNTFSCSHAAGKRWTEFTVTIVPTSWLTGMCISLFSCLTDIMPAYFIFFPLEFTWDWSHIADGQHKYLCVKNHFISLFLLPMRHNKRFIWFSFTLFHT